MSDVRYAIEQRLRFIDFLVAHYGSVNRAALVDYFGISLPQASHDIGDYMKIAAENIVYDKSVKTYIRGANFKRVYA